MRHQRLHPGEHRRQLFQYKFRTIVPEDCVGDCEEDSHRNNLRDVGRRYCDISTSDAVIEWLEGPPEQRSAREAVSR